MHPITLRPTSSKTFLRYTFSKLSVILVSSHCSKGEIFYSQKTPRFGLCSSRALCPCWEKETDICVSTELHQHRQGKYSSSIDVCKAVGGGKGDKKYDFVKFSFTNFCRDLLCVSGCLCWRSIRTQPIWKLWKQTNAAGACGVPTRAVCTSIFG